jgi:hypothetical protein
MVSDLNINGSCQRLGGEIYSVQCGGNLMVVAKDLIPSWRDMDQVTAHLLFDQKV